MNDEQLKTMSERELRARFNAAPDYLKTLLARKRILDEGTLWEIDLGRRAVPPRSERNP